jgi:NAD(P)-dependent dehydrogenase (short-subunit alcohol dehydrogenase family)
VIIRLDVSEPNSIREFVSQFAQQIGELDVLINNAGVVAQPLARNSCGHEMQLATNYLGPFALSGLLLPFFRTGTQTRVVNVGSLSHLFGNLQLDDINWHSKTYGEWRAYAQSKLALLTFTLELSRRLQQSGSQIISVAAHPGFAATDIGNNNPLLKPTKGAGKWLNDKISTFIPPAEDASRSIIYTACAEEVRNGEYYGPGGWFEIAGEPAKARIARAATHVDIAQQLWAVSESMSGVSYHF